MRAPLFALGAAAGSAGARPTLTETPSDALAAVQAGATGSVFLHMTEDTGAQLNNVEGLVKWFDPRKGFGFIVGPEGQDIFAHYSRIQGDGFRVLKDGSTVVYDAERGEKGWHATRIVRKDEVEVKVRPRSGYARSPRR